MQTETTIDPRCYEDCELIANSIKKQVQLKEAPTVGIICGSGLGDLAELLTDQKILPYSKIQGFPATNVIGHKGNLVFGLLGGKSVVCLQGRFHPYEHAMNLALCALPVVVMHLLGVKTLIVSNAAGGLNPNFKYGDLMLIKDHIFVPGLAGFSPLVGPNDERFGERFPDIHEAYDIKLRKMCVEISKNQGFHIHEGVYCMVGGPQYETPAESFMIRNLGADAVGMSTCHEVVIAKQSGMRVIGISLITNIANMDVDTSVKVSHVEVLEAAHKAKNMACNFVSEIVKRLD